MKTAISWTDESSNPIGFRNKETGQMGWQCIKVSDGCKGCYAETLNMSTRISYGTFLPYTVQSMQKVEAVIKEKELHRLATSKALSGKMVFLEDMSDFLGDFIPQELRERVMDVIEKRTDVIFQILTKRPENLRRFIPRWLEKPLPHVWVGTTIENQKVLDSRAIELLSFPAAVHFFSVEPQLEHIDLKGYRPKWVICGGESGPKCRAFDWNWARSLRDQCQESNVAFWMKQGGGHPNKRHELADLPEDLRVRELPK